MSKKLPDVFKFQVGGGLVYTATRRNEDYDVTWEGCSGPVSYHGGCVEAYVADGKWKRVFEEPVPSKPFSVTIDGVLYHADADPTLDLFCTAMEYMSAKAKLEKYKA